MRKFSRRDAVQAMTAVGGLLIAGVSQIRVAAQNALVVRRDILDLQQNFPDELKKFAAALQALKDRKLPAGSAWDVNADTHRIYCARDTKEIHGTWWFMPWHRAYLHATERSLQLALGDKTVALPYWHWPRTPEVPQAYRTGALKHERFGEQDTLQPFRLDLTNMAAPSYRGRIENGMTVEIPFGGHSAIVGELRSAIEGTPHGAVHNAVGSFLKNANGEPIDRNGNVVPFEQRIPGDMSILARAAFDPVFFAHHANIDRLWEFWRTPQDSAHAKSEPWEVDGFARRGGQDVVFDFLDLNSSGPYQVKVAQTRSTLDLGYRYAAPGDVSVASAPSAATTTMLTQDAQPTPPDASLLSDQVRTTRVPAGASSAPSALTAGARRILLTLKGVEVAANFGADIAVYLMPGSASAFRPADGAYAGLVSVVGTGATAGKTNIALDVTDAVGRLQERNSGIQVVLVPVRSSPGGPNPRPVSIDAIELHVVP